MKKKLKNPKSVESADSSEPSMGTAGAEDGFAANSGGAPARGGQPMLEGTLVQSSYSGPLPPPAWLEHYDRTLPGAADRILKMAERQQEIGEKNQESARESRKRGMTLGIAALMALVGASFAVAMVTRDALLTGIFLTPTTISAAIMFLVRR